MIQLTSCEIDNIQDCRRDLEAVLKILDTVGAGIAAIHVNAAIEQLKKNLAIAVPETEPNRSPFFVEEDLG
ncbi:MAG: hypothetical protein ABJ205_07420 [Erythrobacter sp.]|uniref:hypothetical protein n=1 Tax=Erythrobacter sp. TaxID=1042 RepID=UPI003265D8B1